MYDRIVIRLKEDYLPVGYDWKSVLSESSQKSSDINGNGVKGVWRGGLVKARKRYIEFSGSLPKCLNGHNCNVKPITLSEVKKIVDEMSSEFSAPMQYAEVTLLEFSANLIVTHSPESYANAIKGIEMFDSWNIRGTNYIDREDYVRLKFYDKLKEASSKKELPKPCPLHPNLLRYEMTLYNKELQQMFGKLRCEDLWNKSVYWQLVSEWLYYFEHLQFHTVYDTDFCQIKNITSFEDWVICKLDSNYELIRLVKSLFDARSEKKPDDRIFHYKLKQRINLAKERFTGQHKNPELIGELKNCIYSYLSWLLERSEDGMTVEEERKIFGSEG